MYWCLNTKIGFEDGKFLNLFVAGPKEEDWITSNSMMMS